MSHALHSSPVTAKRRALATACGHLRGLDLDLGSQENIEAATSSLRISRSPNVYVRLADFVFSSYLHAAPNKGHSQLLLESVAAQVGPKVTGRLVRTSPNAYFNFCDETDRQPSVMDLRDIMLRSIGTPLRFMEVANEINVDLEVAFGIDVDYSSYSSTINPRFGIIPNGDEPLFGADDDRFTTTVSNAPTERHDELPFGPYDRCPARTFMRKRFWPDLINLAANVDGAFPQHFRLIQAERALDG